MAKKKKTIEELLEEVLVREEEQPYDLRENWVWTNFEVMIKPVKSSSKSIKQKEYLDDGKYPVVDQGIDLIGGYTNSLENLYSGELPIIVFGDHTRCIKWVDFEFAQGADGTKVLRPLKGLHEKYFYFLLKSIDLPNKGYSRHFKYLKEIHIPLPPLNEQMRIADKVERLLSKVDEAKRLIEEVKESFELRQAAILDKAFRGELPREINKNRTENTKPDVSNHNTNGKYKVPQNWNWVALESICETITDGDHQAPPKAATGIPFLVISNINKGLLDFNNTRFVPEEYYDKLHTKRKPVYGDVLYSTVGSYGIPVLVDSDKKFCFQRHIAILKPSDNINSKFLYYIMKSKLVYNQATDYATGTAQMTVPLSGLRKIIIPLPPVEEQEYLVKFIEHMFEKESHVEQYCKVADEKIELLSRSLLSKAFKGELGTNDPSEENAMELLKEVLQEQFK